MPKPAAKLVYPFKPNTGIPLPLERFYHWEKQTPDKICFTQAVGGDNVSDISWREAGKQIRSIAAYLLELGLQPGDKVAIISKNCAEWIMADLAIWMAGGVSVPLFPTVTADTLRLIMEHSESRFLFVGQLGNWNGLAPAIPENVSCIRFPLGPDCNYPNWLDIIAAAKSLQASPARDHAELATIIYTSGTTGLPKGVMHTFGSIAAAATQSANLYEASTDDRLLSYLPLSHVAERMVVEMMQLYQGSHVYFAESLDTFIDDLRRARPTIFFAVPRIWAKFQARIFAQFGEKKLSLLLAMPVVSSVVKKRLRSSIGLDHARLCFSGAAPISPSLIAWFRHFGIEILEVYGMTENMAYSHSTQPGTSRVGIVGFANPDVEVKLGEGNEILVRSPSNMIGYYKDPEKTAAALDADGFLHTGDLGVFEPDGSLKISGRIKEIFKTSKGKYVAPFPIESRLQASPHVDQVCVVGTAMPQPLALVALVEPDLELAKTREGRDTITRDLQRLYDQVNATLDPHEKLKTIVITSSEWAIDNGILTPTLKIKRNVLESRYQDRIENWYDTRDKVQWE